MANTAKGLGTAAHISRSCATHARLQWHTYDHWAETPGTHPTISRHIPAYPGISRYISDPFFCSAAGRARHPAPAALAVTTVFRRGPFPLADDRQSRAIDEEMQPLLPGRVAKSNVEVLPPPGERRVIRHPQVESHQPEHGREKAFGLAKWEVEDEPGRQGGFDGDVRVLPLAAPSTFRSQVPTRQRRPGTATR